MDTMLPTPQSSSDNLATEVFNVILYTFPGLSDQTFTLFDGEDLEMVAVEGPPNAMKRVLKKKSGWDNIPSSSKNAFRNSQSWQIHLSNKFLLRCKLRAGID